MPFLVGLLMWAMSGFIARILVGAGFAVLGSITFGNFINYFVAKMLSQLSAVPYVGLLGLADIDKAISIMVSAVLMRVYLATAVQSIKIVKK